MMKKLVLRRCSLSPRAKAATTASKSAKAAHARPRRRSVGQEGSRAERHQGSGARAAVELAQNGPGKDKYPQADAIVALEQDDITYKRRRHVVTKHHSIVKLLDPQRGKEKYADLHIPFDSKRETLTIDVARTVNDDGKPQAASKDEIGDIVPARLADATIYSDVRERVVTFPAVDTGSVARARVHAHDEGRRRIRRWAASRCSAQWNPMLERVVTITAPSGVDAEVRGRRHEARAEDSRRRRQRRGRSRSRTSRIGTPRWARSPDAAVLPRLVYGFQPSWQKVLEPVAERFLARRCRRRCPHAIKEEADRIVAGANDDERQGDEAVRVRRA